MKVLILLCIRIALFLVSLFGWTQFTVQADLRLRPELRHGFNNLFPDQAEPGVFVAQRSRLNLGFKEDILELRLSVQDVSTWGDTRQILEIDGNDSFSLFQAWAEVEVSENLFIKAGRQVLSYDDERILGELDWAMQGRFHDAVLVRWEKPTNRLHLAAAFSQTQQQNEGNTFPIQGFFTYKTMQMAWYHHKWEKAQFSLLFLNTGFQKFDEVNLTEGDGVYYRHTLGSFFQTPLKVIQLNGSFYYQFGKAAPETDLSAWQAMLEATWKPKNWLYGLGVEVLSGTNQGSTGDNSSFFPLYGTNHKFNGFMDYFYVGNHANNVGLTDVYGKLVLPAGSRGSLLVKAHYFAAQASLTEGADAFLGAEMDIVYTRKIRDYIQLNLGYSQMFATESMSLVKAGRPYDNANFWGWAQLIVNPQIFSTSKIQ